MIKKLVQAGITAALVGASFLVASPAAHATARNGVCDAGEFCLYYNSGETGSISDFTGNVSDYGTGTGCQKFIHGNAAGQCVKNNAASVWNRTSVVVTVFYKSGYAGAIDAVGSGNKKNLNSNLYNENAGHIFGKSGNTSLSTALYKDSARITAYFDGYLNTAGRHEGIDIAHGAGTPVYALWGGHVNNVDPGADSGASADLSTIAVYNATLGKTIIYLHTRPLAGLAGHNIVKGQQIGVEASRGAPAAHTHVEMRSGSQNWASVSHDSTLSNPNPTAFWMARGYNICCD